MVTGLLQEMVVAANGRPLIIVNPRLQDVPSGSGVMGIQGRAERANFVRAFQDVFFLQLLVPGSAMYPITGMVMKRSLHSPWVVYDKQGEDYEVAAGFDPYTYSRNEIGEMQRLAKE